MPASSREQTASRPVRIAYLVSHPIQYQAPLLRRIAAEPGIELHVFFRSTVSVEGYFDKEFGDRVEWDVPLLDGYRSEFLPAFGPADDFTRWRPFNHGLFGRLKAGGFDVLWVHGYSIWFNLLALAEARLLGMRTFLRDEATLISRERSPLKTVLKKIFHRVLDRFVDCYLTIGTLNRDYYLAQRVNPGKLREIGYAVDNAYFRGLCEKAAETREAFRRSLGLEPGRPVILYASKLTARKRADELLAAHGEIRREKRLEPPPYLLIVGSGELEPELRRRVAEEKIPDVHFLGFRNQSALPAFFDLCDVFVLTSQHEPWGLIINEVMNAAKPVIISSDVGCGPDLVRDGENGFILPVGDISGLVKALEKILGDRAEGERMGAASARIISDWDFERNVCGLLKACRSVGLIADNRGEPT